MDDLDLLIARNDDELRFYRSLRMTLPPLLSFAELPPWVRDPRLPEDSAPLRAGRKRARVDYRERDDDDDGEHEGEQELGEWEQEPLAPVADPPPRVPNNALRVRLKLPKVVDVHAPPPPPPPEDPMSWGGLVLDESLPEFDLFADNLF